MKIYIAGCFEERLRLRDVANQLWHQGHEVTSTWLDEVAQPPHMNQDEFYKKLAIKDLCEIQAADLLLHDTIVMSSRGGASNEFGYALGAHQKKLLWIVGPARSPFHQLADRRFDDWETCIEALATYQKEITKHAV